MDVPTPDIQAILARSRAAFKGVRAVHGQKPVEVHDGSNRATMGQSDRFVVYGGTRTERQDVSLALSTLPRGVRGAVLPLVREVHICPTLPDNREGVALAEQGILLFSRSALNRYTTFLGEQPLPARDGPLWSLVDDMVREEARHRWFHVAWHEAFKVLDYADGDHHRYRSQVVSGPLGAGPSVCGTATSPAPEEDFADTSARLTRIHLECHQDGKTTREFVGTCLGQKPFADKYGYILKERWHLKPGSA